MARFSPLLLSSM